jgi:hypothetical protein
MAAAPADSDTRLGFKRVYFLGETMRLDKIDGASVQSNERKSAHDEDSPRLLTPARRAALDALEREFRDLLQAR